MYYQRNDHYAQRDAKSSRNYSSMQQSRKSLWKDELRQRFTRILLPQSVQANKTVDQPVYVFKSPQKQVIVMNSTQNGAKFNQTATGGFFNMRASANNPYKNIDPKQLLSKVWFSFELTYIELDHSGGHGGS